MPIENNSVDWKTTAPKILAIAKSSFFCFNQIKLFTHSGNSVAKGAIKSAKIEGAIPKEVEKDPNIREESWLTYHP